MLFQFEVNLTEEDYLRYNYFHTLESDAGRKQLQKTCTLMVALLAALTLLVVLLRGFNTVSLIYVATMTVFILLYVLFFKRMVRKNIKKQVYKLKQLGKLPFDTYAKLEFYEDKIVEITAEKRVEQRYESLERLCLVRGETIYLYHSSVAAFILPIAQLKAQLEYEELFRFLSEKCPTIEHY